MKFLCILTEYRPHSADPGKATSDSTGSEPEFIAFQTNTARKRVSSGSAFIEVLGYPTKLILNIIDIVIVNIVRESRNSFSILRISCCIDAQW